MLNAKQKAFVREYPKDLNATQAAIRAGYSAKTAKQIGSRLLTNVDVAKAIKAATDKATEAADITVAEIVEGLKAEAKGFGEDSSASARVSAWGLLGKYKKMFTDKLELSADASFAETLRLARERAQKPSGGAGTTAKAAELKGDASLGPDGDSREGEQ